MLFLEGGLDTICWLKKQAIQGQLIFCFKNICNCISRHWKKHFWRHIQNGMLEAIGNDTRIFGNGFNIVALQWSSKCSRELSNYQNCMNEMKQLCNFECDVIILIIFRFFFTLELRNIRWLRWITTGYWLFFISPWTREVSTVKKEWCDQRVLLNVLSWYFEKESFDFKGHFF